LRPRSTYAIKTGNFVPKLVTKFKLKVTHTLLLFVKTLSHILHLSFLVNAGIQFRCLHPGQSIGRILKGRLFFQTSRVVR